MLIRHDNDLFILESGVLFPVVLEGTKIPRDVLVVDDATFAGMGGGGNSFLKGPYEITAAGMTELQAAQTQKYNLDINGVPTGGTFTLQAFNLPAAITPPIAFDADATAVQTALNTIVEVKVAAVTGTNPHFQIEIDGALGDYFGLRSQVLLTVANNSLTGGTASAPVLTETQRGQYRIFGQELFTGMAGDLIAGLVVRLKLPWDGTSPGVTLITPNGDFDFNINVSLNSSNGGMFEGPDASALRDNSAMFVLNRTVPVMIHLSQGGGVGSADAGSTTGSADVYVNVVRGRR
jgi:hypothetical protein